jgi:hypothetical protein
MELKMKIIAIFEVDENILKRMTECPEGDAKELFGNEVGWAHSSGIYLVDSQIVPDNYKFRGV